MEATDVGETVNFGRKLKVCKPYVAPKLQRLSPVAVKGLLSRHADTSDAELEQLIESVDRLHGARVHEAVRRAFAFPTSSAALGPR